MRANRHEACCGSEGGSKADGRAAGPARHVRDQVCMYTISLRSPRLQKTPESGRRGCVGNVVRSLLRRPRACVLPEVMTASAAQSSAAIGRQRGPPFARFTRYKNHNPSRGPACSAMSNTAHLIANGVGRRGSPIVLATGRSALVGRPSARVLLLHPSRRRLSYSTAPFAFSLLSQTTPPHLPLL